MSKMRVFGAFLIIMALIVMLLPATEADAGSSASAFTIKGGKLIEYKGSDSVVSVPDTVTTIGKAAFEDNDTVTKIVIPDSVKKIEAYAFWGCDSLKTVVLGKGLTTIDDMSFLNCDGLKTMTIPANIRSIGIQAFADCDRFEDITIPPQVVDISEDAFDGDYLLNIHCETGTYADKYAQDFYERQKDMTVYADPEQDSTSNEKFPEDGVYSGADAAGGDPSKEHTESQGEVFGSTTVVDNQAVVFMQNAGLPVQNGNEELQHKQPENVSKDMIVERAFYRNEQLQEAVLDENIRKIDRFAYARSKIRTVTLPDGLEEIGYAAFYHCDNLAEVNIPQSVTKVDGNAFAHTPWVENFLRTGHTNNGDKSDFLISGGVLVAYRGDVAEVTIPEGVRVIAGDVFADHGEIQRIILPVSLVEINEDAFVGCNLESVEYNGSLNMDLVEERVRVNALSAGAKSAGDGMSFSWVIAALMMLCGGFFVLRKSK